MGLDYEYTCSDINRSIEQFKEDIKWDLSDMIEKLKEGQETEKELISTFVDEIYYHFEENFENVRGTNESMRREANYQIENYFLM